MGFFVVRDLVKLSPIPLNQQQFPFGNARRNATCNCSGIIQTEVPPSFLDLPSPQVKPWEQPTADMTRHIRGIAETLNHGLATESTPIVPSEGLASTEKQTAGIQLQVAQSYSFFFLPQLLKQAKPPENSQYFSSENRSHELWLVIVRKQDNQRNTFKSYSRSIFLLERYSTHTGTRSNCTWRQRLGDTCVSDPTGSDRQVSRIMSKSSRS